MGWQNNLGDRGGKISWGRMAKFFTGNVVKSRLCGEVAWQNILGGRVSKNCGWCGNNFWGLDQVT